MPCECQGLLGYSSCCHRHVKLPCTDDGAAAALCPNVLRGQLCLLSLLERIPHAAAGEIPCPASPGILVVYQACYRWKITLVSLHLNEVRLFSVSCSCWREQHVNNEKAGTQCLQQCRACPQSCVCPAASASADKSHLLTGHNCNSYIFAVILLTLRE